MLLSGIGAVAKFGQEEIPSYHGFVSLAERSERTELSMNWIYAGFVVTVLVLTHLLFGGGDGTRLIYVLPGYVLLGLVGLLTVVSLRKNSSRPDRGCLVAILLLAIYLFARIALSPVAYLAGFDLFAVLGSLIIYFVSACFVTGQAQRTAVVCSLLILGLGQVAVGVYQFVQDAGFNPLVSDGRPDSALRASGLFISPNHLAGFLEAVLLLGTSLCVWGGFKVWGKMVIGYLTLVCLAGLLLTGSRGGYLSATAGMVVFVVLSVWTARASLSEAMGRRIVAIVAAVVLVGGALVFVANRSLAIQQRANAVFVSEDIRLSLWDAAWKQFKLAPVFGTGSRTYVYYGRMFRAPALQGDPVFAHNDFLQMLAEYGMAGVLLLVGFLVTHLRQGWRKWHSMVGEFSPVLSNLDEKNSMALQIGSISAVAACLVHAAMDFNLHIPANMLLTAWLFGMLATRRPDAFEERIGWRNRVIYAIPAALGLWMLVAGIPKLPGELFAETARGKFATGEVGPAVQDAGQALGWGARNPELHFQIGEAQRIMSQHHRSVAARTAAIEEAYEAYAEAVAIFPKDVKLLLHAAWALDRLGRFEEAENLLSQARELDPNYATVWTFSALHWQLQDKPAKALADYRKAFQIGGGLVPVVLAELGEKIDPQELEKAASN